MLKVSLKKPIVSLFIVVLMVGGSLVIFSDFARSPAAPWPSERLTDEQHDSFSPDVAVCDEGPQCEYIHVVWAEEVQPGGGTQIYYIRGSGRGADWQTESVPISEDPVPVGEGYNHRAINPSIAVWGDTIHVVFAKWVEVGLISGWAVFYQRSTDNGNNWLQPEEQISDDFGIRQYDDLSLNLSVAATENHVHVVYSIQYLGDPFQIIRYKRAIGPSWTWFHEMDISESKGLPLKEFPDVACSGDNVHVSWVAHDHLPSILGNHVYYNRSEDNGGTWVHAGDIEEMLTSPLIERSEYAGLSIAASDNNIHVVFSYVKETETTYWVYHQRSTDNGDTWFTDGNGNQEEKKIPTGDLDSRHPSVDASSGLISVVYEAKVSEEIVQIIHIPSRDNGDTWGGGELVSPFRAMPGTSLSRYPSISLAGNDRHVVFQDYTGDNWEIYYAYDIDGVSFYEHSLPSVSFSGCAVGVGTTVYLFGGYAPAPGPGHIDDILKDYGDGWLPAGTLPDGLADMSCAYDGTQYIYIFGGETAGGKTNEILQYDVTTEQNPDPLGQTLPTARSRTSAAFDGTQYIYIFGGSSDTVLLNDVVKFDTTLAEVPHSIGPVLPSARAGTAAVWDPREGTDGHGYVFGGEISGGYTTDEIVRFDPLVAPTEAINSLPDAVVPSSAVWDDTHAYIFYDDKIVRYDSKTNQVSTMCVRLPNEISNAPAAMQDNAMGEGRRALLIGGIYSNDLMSWTSNKVVSYGASYWGY